MRDYIISKKRRGISISTITIRFIMVYYNITYKRGRGKLFLVALFLWICCSSPLLFSFPALSLFRAPSCSHSFESCSSRRPRPPSCSHSFESCASRNPRPSPSPPTAGANPGNNDNIEDEEDNSDDDDHDDEDDDDNDDDNDSDNNPSPEDPPEDDPQPEETPRNPDPCSGASRPSHCYRSLEIKSGEKDTDYIIPASAQVESFKDFKESLYWNAGYDNQSICGTIAHCDSKQRNQGVNIIQKRFLSEIFGELYSTIHFGEINRDYTSMSKEGCYVASLLSSIGRLYWLRSGRHLTVGQVKYLLHAMRSTPTASKAEGQPLPAVNGDGFVRSDESAYQEVLRRMGEFCNNCRGAEMHANRVTIEKTAPLAWESTRLRKQLEPGMIVKNWLRDNQKANRQVYHFMTVSKTNGKLEMIDPLTTDYQEIDHYRKRRFTISIRDFRVRFAPHQEWIRPNVAEGYSYNKNNIKNILVKLWRIGNVT